MDDPLRTPQPAQSARARGLLLFVQICALNEQGYIGDVIRGIPRAIPGIAGVRVLVVDDGSTDQTAAEAFSAGADAVVRHVGNKGLARAFQRGMDECLARGADIVVNIDADGQYPPQEIPQLVAPVAAGQADIAIGDRQINRLAHFSPLKRALQKLGSRVVGLASGLPVPDAVSGFRAYSREAALRLFVTATFSYTVESLIKAGRNKHKVVFVPIHARNTERPSRLYRSVWSFVRQQAAIIIHTYATYRPMATFGVLSAPCFALAALAWLRLALAPSQSLDLTAFLAWLAAGLALFVCGASLIAVGMVASLVSQSRRLSEELLYRARARQYGSASESDSGDSSPSA